MSIKVAGTVVIDDSRAISGTSVTASSFVGTSGTGSLNIPTGTTAQRPTPTNGMIRMNTTTGYPEWYSSNYALWIPFSSSRPLPAIGEALGGGFFAGYISYAGNGVADHYLIVSPKATGETTKAWDSTIGGSTIGATSLYDGAANTAAIPVDARYAAAQFVKGLSIGGYTDWYIPAKNELEVAYYFLKNVTQNNYSPGTYGSNANAVPPAEPVSTTYTAAVPAQTSVVAFQVGNTEAFADYTFWSSTEYSTTLAWYQNFYSGSPGNQGSDVKPFGNYVRAFRRLAI